MLYPYINLKIDSKKYSFLVDTGSNKTIMFRLKSTKTKFYRRRKWVRFRTFLLPSYQIKVDFKFNNFQLKTDILIVDWHKYLEYAKDIVRNICIYSYFQKFNYDGILGLDLLKYLILEVKCTTNRSFILTPDKISKLNSNPTPLKKIGNHIAAKVYIKGVEYLGIIDTGINICDIVMPEKIEGFKESVRRYVLFWNSKELITIYKIAADTYLFGKKFRNLRFGVLRMANINAPIICYPLLRKFGVIIFDRCKNIYIQ